MSLYVDLHHQQGRFQLECSFSVRGGITALFGASGAGKTTTLDLIAGVRRPAAGRVLLDGRVLCDTERGIHVPTHRRGVGYVFQEPRLFPHRNVRSNLLYSVRRRRDIPVALGLDEVTELLGLKDVLQRRPAGLSGGEAHRVAIGRALLSGPRLLLLDEPLAALDEPRRAEILPFIEALRDRVGIPIVYVSHRVDEVRRLSDRVVVLKDGSSTAEGAPDHILARPEALQRSSATRLPR